MPLPTPDPGQSEEEFVAECMSDDLMVTEYPDENQRLVICESQWNKEDRAMTDVVLVAGPPCAGKTTYATSIMTDRDVIVDLDLLTRALTINNMYIRSAGVKLLAISAKRAICKQLEISYDDIDRAYVIATMPLGIDRDLFSKKYDAESILLLPTKDECKRRLNHDDSRPIELSDEISKAIDDWFNNYTESENDTVITDKEDRAMAIKVNTAGRANANKLIGSGDVDTTGDWSFSADDGNAILGDPPDWKAYAKWFLAIDSEADPETKDAYKYPFGKNGKVYRKALTAIRQRSGQQGETDIFDAAGVLLDKIDAESEGSLNIPQWMQRHKGRGYEMRAAEDNGAEILLYNVIGGWWDEFSACGMEWELKKLGDISNISVRINSPGGDVFDAIAIYNMLKRHPAMVTVYIDGLAASAATIVAMAGDQIIMPKNAQMMIHNAWTCECGDYRMMNSAARRLEKANASIIETYAEKADIDRTEIAMMMDDETWLTAGEAVSLGLADSIERATEARTAWDLSCYRNAPKAIEYRKGDASVNYESRNATVDAPQIGENGKIVGYAAKWNEPTDIGGFIETVQRGAFTRALAESQDVRALYNHEINMILGRNVAGTLRLVEDDIGLWYEIDPPETQIARDCMTSISRGDVTGSSFGFAVPPGGDVWDFSGPKPKRTLTDVDLFDVGPVVFPAYESSSSSVRSAPNNIETRRKKLNLLSI